MVGGIDFLWFSPKANRQKIDLLLANLETVLHCTAWVKGNVQGSILAATANLSFNLTFPVLGQGLRNIKAIGLE